jgi:hypothetical protein
MQICLTFTSGLHGARIGAKCAAVLRGCGHAAMLALTDSQLALLAIAATAVALHKRAAWLEQPRGQARPAADPPGAMAAFAKAG